jgi:hypothetical protein
MWPVVVITKGQAFPGMSLQREQKVVSGGVAAVNLYITNTVTVVRFITT